MDIGLFKSLSRYPFVYEGEFYDAIELNQNKTCKEKCQVKDCLKLQKEETNLSEYICSKGYNNILLSIKDSKFILNGLIFEDNSTVPKGRKDVRTKWIINRNIVHVLSMKLLEIEKHIDDRVNETIEKNFSMFHDFKTSMSIFISCTQDIINKLPGSNFEEKLKKSDSSYHNLYNSLQLITSQLGMVDVIINPKRIQFGNKKTVNLYRFFEKIKILFGHLASKRRDISIQLTSEGWIRDSLCYDSIEFIPLILLDNALKYSVPDSDVEIKLEQSYGKVKVIVKNIGPFVSDENKEKIFQKFFRDKSGEAFAKEGIGMGLWIAQGILKAHNSQLHYFKDQNETRQFGLNIFSFDLPTT